jgi:translation initiation factor IF-2
MTDTVGAGAQASQGAQPTTTTQATDSAPLGGATGTTAAAADTTTAPAAEVLANLGNVAVTLPQSALKALRQKEREKGAQQATGALEEAAKAAGFSTFADALAALNKLGGAAQGTQPATGTAPAGQQTTVAAAAPAATAATAPTALTQADIDRAIQNAKQQWEQDALAPLRQTIERQGAEIKLRDALTRGGVREVDFAMTLLQQAVEATPQGQEFDQTKWLTDLRRERPYVFGAPAPAATTGVSPAAAAAPAAGPAAVTGAGASSTQFDARSAKPDEVARRFAAMGIPQPGL